MKKIIFLIICGSLLISEAFASNGGRGGGDLCEDRIKIIRDDIKSWMQAGGPSGLEFPAGITLSQYLPSMAAALSAAQIRCVGEGDVGYPVNIDGTPKVCVFDNSKDKPSISCDFKKFQTMDDESQYVLVHHEYAGIAGIEIPNGSDSNYQISNQISGFLVTEFVKKLAVKGSGIDVRNNSSEASSTDEHATFLMQTLKNLGVKSTIDSDGEETIHVKGTIIDTEGNFCDNLHHTYILDLDVFDLNNHQVQTIDEDDRYDCKTISPAENFAQLLSQWGGNTLQESCFTGHCVQHIDNIDCSHFKKSQAVPAYDTCTVNMSVSE